LTVAPQARLAELSANAKPVSEASIEKNETRLRVCLAAWRERQQATLSVIDDMAEGMGKPKEELLEVRRVTVPCSVCVRACVSHSPGVCDPVRVAALSVSWLSF
jgi:hypothetical protein